MSVYQPLDIAKNEIRLLYFKHNGTDPTSRTATASPQPQEILQFEMRAVSLDAYTEKSRNFMASRGSMTYSFREYAFPDLSSEVELGSSAVKASFLQTVETTVDNLFLQSDFGRWIWGDYQTLSYTWGDETETRPIVINGLSMEVTTNLEDFLRGYVHSDENDSSERMGIWIDAICINQKDTEERNFQVKRMRDIYSRSSGSLVWLGKAGDDSEKAMDMIESVGKQLFTTGDEMSNYMRALRQKPVFAPGAWKAFCMLISRPYWQRLWVIQEIALSQDSLDIVCGDRDVLWPLFLGAINTFAHDFEGLLDAVAEEFERLPEPDWNGEELLVIFQDSFNRVQQLGSFRDALSQGQKHVDLKQVLTISRGSKQSNPRDKVYGILGLVNERLTELISPNYKMSAAEIFADFAQAAIRSSGSLDVITSQGAAMLEQTLPSWVPNLTESIAVSLEMTPKVPYEASKDSTAVVSFGDGELIARGLLMDIIDGIGGSYGDTGAGDGVLQPNHANNPYDGKAGARDAIWHTLLADRDPATEVASELYGHIMDLPWEDDEDDPEAESGAQAIFNDLRRMNSEFRVGGQEFKSYFPAKSSGTFTRPKWGLDPFHRIWTFAAGRRLITTEKGYLGQARKDVQRGDLVCILLGCSVPVILRPHTDGPISRCYRLVGEAYVHGAMNGEAMDWLDESKRRLEDIRIC